MTDKQPTDQKSIDKYLCTLCGLGCAGKLNSRCSSLKDIKTRLYELGYRRLPEGEPPLLTDESIISRWGRETRWHWNIHDLKEHLFNQCDHKWIEKNIDYLIKEQHDKCIAWYKEKMK